MNEREEIKIREMLLDARDDYLIEITECPHKGQYMDEDDFIVNNIYKYGVEKSLEGKRESDSI